MHVIICERLLACDCLAVPGWGGDLNLTILDLGNNPDLDGNLPDWNLATDARFLELLDIGGDSFTGNLVQSTSLSSTAMKSDFFAESKSLTHEQQIML